MASLPSPRPDTEHLQLFGVTGAGLSTVRYYQNGGKMWRYGLDQWDRVSSALNRQRLLD
jgi:NADH-ubiquinone oxidoreductase MWFE subunit